MKESFREFEDEARAQGFEEVVARQWAPHTIVNEHSHPFAFKAVVVNGELWLTVGNDTRHLQTGDTFELDRDVLHSERYGSTGATYWVARRA
jgi:quercetin dioxygenase-like cupin family protein